MLSLITTTITGAEIQIVPESTKKRNAIPQGIYTRGGRKPLLLHEV